MNILKRIKSKFKKIIRFCYANLFFLKKNYCPFCNMKSTFLPFGVKKRKSALCVYCNSLERHRFLYFIYKKYFLETSKKISILHTAPEKSIHDVIVKNSNIDYVACDIFPDAYKFCNCLKENVTSLSFKDESFDFVLSNHVLEHILSEQAYFNELRRVLKNDGKLIITFPVSLDKELTFQDDSITSKEGRLKYYEQDDHVRLYGKEVFSRFEKEYNAKIIYPLEILSEDEIKKYGILKDEFCMVIPKGNSL